MRSIALAFCATFVVSLSACAHQSPSRTARPDLSEPTELGSMQAPRLAGLPSLKFKPMPSAYAGVAHPSP
jgi:hypothetical protein